MGRNKKPDNDQLRVRLPTYVHEQIQAMAEEQSTGLSAVITNLLEAQLAYEKRNEKASTRQFLKALRNIIEMIEAKHGEDDWLSSPQASREVMMTLRFLSGIMADRSGEDGGNEEPVHLQALAGSLLRFADLSDREIRAFGFGYSLSR